MAINSAEELHELIATLGNQFRDAHQPGAQQLWSQADQHIEHVAQNGGSWITREISSLHADWQHHKIGLQNAERFFEHHAAQLSTVAAAPVNLSQKVLAGPLGRIATGVGVALAGTWGTILGTPTIPHSVLEVFRVSGFKRLESFASKMGKDGKGVNRVFSSFGVKDFGKLSKGGGHVMAGFGFVLAGFKVAGDLSTYRTQVASGDIGGAAMSVTDIAASGLKASPIPLLYASGVAVSLVSDDIKAGVDLVTHWTPLPAVTAQSMHDVYIPGAIDGLKSGLKKAWEAF